MTVSRPLIQQVTNYLEETGTTEPLERVEVHARVRGYLQEIFFEDGQDVQVGQQLYLIQPREYDAKVDSARATVDAANVSLSRAEIELTRQENLLRDNATPQSNVDSARAARDGAKAELAAAYASLDQAELDLEYTKVTTPISGRVERTLVKRGNLVGDNQATHLTTVISYDPIHVYFSINERALLQARAASPREKSGNVDLTKIKAYLRRATDSDYLFEGHLDYADLGVDESTGTFTIRAVFENPEKRIFPGLFVRIRIPLGVTENAVLIPERSVAADQAGRYVVIVGDDNRVERRNVVVGAKFGEMVVIMEGLTGEETVVIDGIQRARPGAEVTPKQAELASPAETLESIESGSGKNVDEGAADEGEGESPPDASGPSQ